MIVNLLLHELQTDCYEIHCMSHGVDEIPGPRGAWRRCGDCGHLYQSAEDLVRAHQAVMKDLMSGWSPVPWHVRWREKLRLKFITVDKIFTCPECSHDW